MAMRLPNPGPRARKILRYLGFVVLGIVTFVFAFQMTFPFDRVKDRVIELLADKYEVTIGSVERGFIPGRMYFHAVTMRTRPAKADEVATTFYLEQLEVDLGLLALLHGTAAVKLDAKIGAGHIKGSIALAKTGTVIELAGNDLPSANLPVREVLGLPMSGKIRFVFNLDLPNEKSKAGKVGPSWVKAEGNLELACPSGCVVGDGKTKLKLALNKNQRNQASQAFAEGGIDFGKLNIDSLLADVELKDGKLDITKFEAKSADGDLHIDFGLALNQDLNQSTVTGCLRFNVSPAFLKRDPKTGTAISATGAPLGPDNLFHIKLEGPLRDMRRLGVVCGAPAGKSMDNPGGTMTRPNLPVIPETAPRPAMPVPAPLVPSPPPAAVPEDAGIDALFVPPSGPSGETPPPAGFPPPAPNGGSMAPSAGVGQ